MKKYPFLEPIAKKAIDEATGKDTTPIEAIYLMDMLWYARDNGVTIRLIPSK